MNISIESMNPNRVPLFRDLLSLTNLEVDVLFCVVDDLTNAEIAAKFTMTRKGVENCRTRIAAKLGCSGYGLLTRFARRHQDELLKWHDFLTTKLPPPRCLVT